MQLVLIIIIILLFINITLTLLLIISIYIGISFKKYNNNLVSIVLCIIKMSDNLQYMDIEKDEINYNYDEGQIEKIKQNNNRKKKIKTIIIIVRILLAISIIL